MKKDDLRYYLQFKLRNYFVAFTITTSLLLILYKSLNTYWDLNSVTNLISFSVSKAIEEKELNQELLSLQNEVHRTIQNIEKIYNIQVNARIYYSNFGLLAAYSTDTNASLLEVNKETVVRLRSGKEAFIKLRMKFHHKILKGFFELLFLILSILILYLMFSSLIKKEIAKIIMPLKSTINLIQDVAKSLPISPDKKDIGPRQDDFQEAIILYDSLELLILEISSLEKKLEKMAYHKAEFEVARQVAHDIKSPLYTLKVVKNSLSLPEGKATLLENAIERIEAIVSDLSREAQKNRLSSTSPTHLVEKIIEEKKNQWVDDRIIFRHESLGEEIKVLIDPNVFNRLLSNIFNNSYEAKVSSSDCVIEVSYTLRDSFLLVSISDNGQGIQESVLPKLGLEKVTLGKVEGQGLGLSHAGKVLRSWGGDLVIESETGKGTQVTLKLKIAERADRQERG